MESALFGYFCLPYTSASVDYSRHCNFEIFSWFDLFVFPRYMDDYRGSVVDYSTLYYDRKGYPPKRPVWHSLFCRRDIGNYFFLRCSIYGILDTTFGAIWNSVFLFPSKRQSKKSVSVCNGQRILRIQKKFRFSAIVRKFADYQNFDPGFYIPAILQSGIAFLWSQRLGKLFLVFTSM